LIARKPDLEDRSNFLTYNRNPEHGTFGIRAYVPSTCADSRARSVDESRHRKTGGSMQFLERWKASADDDCIPLRPGAAR
jgi:hypothetical protein